MQKMEKKMEMSSTKYEKSQKQNSQSWALL